MNDATILVGDIGGTNTRLKLFLVRSTDSSAAADGRAPGELVKHMEYENEQFTQFDDVVTAFFHSAPETTLMPVAGCLAVAGPVEENAVRFTNRNWVISGEELEKKFRMAKVRLVNDFVANGYGLLTLDHAKECICLQKGEYMEGAPKACVGAGTGLGECFSTAAPEPGASYETFPSEGGHAEFAPRNDLEMELLNFLKKKFEQKHRVSVERVVSGPGLANIYEFLSSKFPRKVTKQVQQEFDAATDLKGKVVAMHSQKDGQPPYCELCDQAMDIFLAAYGSECGVACLKWIPFGGMYVAGGLTPKNIHRLTEANSPFMGAFYDKGRLTPLLRRVPLYAVMVEDIGQRGAHLVAYKQLMAVRKMVRQQSGIVRQWKAGGALIGNLRKSASAASTSVLELAPDGAEGWKRHAVFAAACAAAFGIGIALGRKR